MRNSNYFPILIIVSPICRGKGRDRPSVTKGSGASKPNQNIIFAPKSEKYEPHRNFSQNE